MTGAPIRIAIVDDHALFRAGMVSLLRQFPDCEIVGQGADGRQAVEIVAHTQPDILLLDVNMPVMDGVQAVKAIKKISNCKILMLTISRRQGDLMGAIQAGAEGYLLKNTEPQDLHKAIRLAVEGKSILSPEITAQVMQTIQAGTYTGSSSNPLTPREMEVLECLSQGATNPQIAQTLHISDNTVKTHVRKIMGKLSASTRTELVRVASQRGLLPSDPTNG
jgi:DNA-binding NarL/FixJ family response regulator